MYEIRRATGRPDMIVRLEDQALIPDDEANSDYQRYLDWLADGNEAIETDLDPVVATAAPLVLVSQNGTPWLIAVTDEGTLSTGLAPDPPAV